MDLKELERHEKLPHRMEVTPNPDGTYFAEIPDLPGCWAEGDNPTDVMEAIADAKRLWIKTQLAEQRPIPQPQQVEEYSGKFVVRIPKTLHRRLATQARVEDTSLNQYVVYLLTEGASLIEGQDRVVRELSDRVSEIGENVSAIQTLLPATLPHAELTIGEALSSRGTRVFVDNTGTLMGNFGTGQDWQAWTNICTVSSGSPEVRKISGSFKRLGCVTEQVEGKDESHL